MKKETVIIGDHFMLPHIFQKALGSVCGDALFVRTCENNWPDQPMKHGYAQSDMKGLKEFFGNPHDVVAFIGDAEILITHLAPVSREMLAELPLLKMIAVSRGGPVNIDIQAARERDILVVNTPGRNASAVAEFTIGAILTETRRIRIGHEHLRSGNWRGDLYRADMTGRELCEMTVGVIGYGAVGTKVVRLLQPFGCRILVHDPYVQLTEDDVNNGVRMVELKNLLGNADVVTLHARVNEETKHMMNAEAFATMKSDALFVNTARGPLCNYDDLYTALTTGGIGAAMLETFSTEPPPEDWPLLQLGNVTLTPHIAGASTHTITCAATQIAEEVRRYLAGEPPRNAC